MERWRERAGKKKEFLYQFGALLSLPHSAWKNGEGEKGKKKRRKKRIERVESS